MIQRTINDVMDEYREEQLEEETIRNIVQVIRRDALMRIINGERAVDVIPESNQRRKLMRDKVLECVHLQGGKRVFVTPLAKKLLGVECDE